MRFVIDIAKARGRKKGSKNIKHKYLLRYMDEHGEWVRIYADKKEYDDEGRIKGGASAVRRIIKRELLGEPYFDAKGMFRPKQGKLQEWRVKTTRTGKVQPYAVPKTRGFTELEFHPSISRLYGRGIPQWMDKFRFEGEVPEKEAPVPPTPVEHEGFSDKPPLHEDPKHLSAMPDIADEHLVRMEDPLDEEEDVLALADELLSTTLQRPKSRAKTKAGRARAKARRYARVGERRVSSLNTWQQAKFSGEDEMQELMSKEGKPLSTLITFGYWNKRKGYKKHKNQLIAEWQRDVRRIARKAADAYKSSDMYQRLQREDARRDARSAKTERREGRAHRISDVDSHARKWLNERMRELEQTGYEVLLATAQDYEPNDLPYEMVESRFDRVARNRIMTTLYDKSEKIAKELGAHVVPMEAADLEAAKQGPHYVITPQEHFELENYRPIASKVLHRLLATLPYEQRTAFFSRLWLDADDDTEERAHLERRLKRQAGGEKVAQEGWMRSWTGKNSIAERLADQPIGAGKSAKKLGELSQANQLYHVRKWYTDAADTLGLLLHEGGTLTAEGAMVESWLRLETKLANVNRRVITERAQFPTVAGPKVEPAKLDKLHREVLADRPEVKFFTGTTSNQDLARKLGINLQTMASVARRDIRGTQAFPTGASPRVSAGTEVERHLQAAKTMHDQVMQARKVRKLSDKLDDARSELKRVKRLGHWSTSGGHAGWHEPGNGVEAFHRVATQMAAAVAAKDVETAKKHNKAYKRLAARVAPFANVNAYDTHVGAGSTPSADDLAKLRSDVHQAQRRVQSSVHILTFEKNRRKTVKKAVPISDFFKALHDYDFALGQLHAAVAA